MENMPQKYIPLTQTVCCLGHFLESQVSVGFLNRADTDDPWSGPGSLHTAHCILHIVHFTLQTAHFTLHTAHRKMHTAHITLHTVHCILHTEQYILHTKHFTLHTEHCRISCTENILGLNILHKKTFTLSRAA